MKGAAYSTRGTAVPVCGDNRLWSGAMDDQKDTQSQSGGRLTGVVDKRQRRALARLGLASLGTYTAPTLLALRPAPRKAVSHDRIVVAA